jgi:tripartite-type tricarboxylate transporter receptor subunit TctC
VNISRQRCLRVAASVAVLLALPQLASAQSFPSRPITIVVPFSAGTGADIVARTVGERLGKALRQQVLVDNRLGANGVVAASYVARAAPDGYTLFMATNTAFSANPSLMKNISYDPIRDFAPISRLGSFALLFVVNPAVPVASVAEFVRYAKANPGKLSVASGTSTALVAAETLKRSAEINFTIVPYKAGVNIGDVVAGHVSAAIAELSFTLPHVRAGALRVLAITNRTRSTVLPEVPTLHEAGIAGFDVTPWGGIFAPANTPKEIVSRLNAELRKILDDPEVKSQFAAAGFDAFSSTPDELGAFVKSQLADWTKMIRDAGIEPQ